MLCQVSNLTARFALLTLLMTVSGCSLLDSASLSSGATGFNQPGATNELVTNWRLKAKISVAHRDEAWSGGLNWNHQQQGDLIIISDPLGRTRLKATDLTHPVYQNSSAASRDQPFQALLQISGEADRYGESLDQLLAERSQLVIPLGYLTDWLFGRSVEGIPAQMNRDPTSDTLLQLRQAEWTIDYARPRKFGNKSLATKIVFIKPGITLKVAITDWDPITAEDDLH